MSFDHDSMNQKYLKNCPEGTIVCRQILHKTRSHFQRGQSSLKTSYAHDYSLRVILDCSDYSINKGCIEFTLTLRVYVAIIKEWLNSSYGGGVGGWGWYIPK